MTDMSLPSNWLKLDWLKSNCYKIHYFGIGFIQVKLTEHQRVHFYSSLLLPIISEEEDIHDHRYDFTSHIVKGIFGHEIYSIDFNSSTHILEQESCQEGVTPDSKPIPCGIFKESRHTYWGGSYSMQSGQFHRVVHGDCITYLERGPTKKKFASVVRSPGAPKVCPFSKKMEEVELWDWVDKMINHWDY